MGQFEVPTTFNAPRRQWRRKFQESHAEQVGDWASYHNTHAGSPDEIEDFYIGPTEVVVANRLFSISHREVYDLFKAWGWEEGPERGDGHLRMVKWIAPRPDMHEHVASVQIMPPDRPGTGELGNSLAIKEAAQKMGLSWRSFLLGPDKDEDRQRRMERQDRVLKAAEEKAHRKRMAVEAAASQKQEAAVAANGAGTANGSMKALTALFEQYPNQRKHAKDWADLFFANYPEFKDRVDHARVGVYLSQAAKRKSFKRPGDYTLDRVGRGIYVWRQIPEPKQVVIEAPPAPEPQPALAPPAPPVTPPPAPPTTLNGSTPDLLSKVATLDGGKYLFQGDDGALYVASGLVRLEV